jgi:hypothetical protein
MSFEEREVQLYFGENFEFILGLLQQIEAGLALLVLDGAIGTVGDQSNDDIGLTIFSRSVHRSVSIILCDNKCKDLVRDEEECEAIYHLRGMGLQNIRK